MIPINHGVSDDKKLKACEFILVAVTYGSLLNALEHWALFVPYFQPQMRPDQNEVEYVEGVYLQLRQHAFEWYTNYRLLALEARLEEMENSEAIHHGRLK